MRDLNVISITIAAIIFVLIWIFGGGFWEAVSVFCMSGQGIIMLMIFVFLIITGLVELFNKIE